MRSDNMRLADIYDDENEWIEETERLLKESKGELSLEEWAKDIPILEGVISDEEMAQMIRDREEFESSRK